MCYSILRGHVIMKMDAETRTKLEKLQDVLKEKYEIEKKKR